MPQTFLGKTFNIQEHLSQQVRSKLAVNRANIEKWQGYLTRPDMPGNWEEQIGRAEADTAYYLTGKGAQEVFEDWRIREAEKIAPSLGITSAQLITNPQLADDPAALAKYTGQDIVIPTVERKAGDMTSEQAAQSAMARTGKQMAQISINEFTEEEKRVLGITAPITPITPQISPQQATEGVFGVSGYSGPSIVDYLKSINQPSDFTSRTQLAEQFGIKDYTGTGPQNTELLRILRGQVSTPTTIPTGSVTGGQTGITLPETPGDTANYAGILASGQALTTPDGAVDTDQMPAWLKSYLDTIEKPADLTKAYETIAEQEGLTAKQQEVANLTAELNSITAEAQQAQLTLEQQAGGRDITQTFLGRQQQEIIRQAAIKSLPVQAQLSAAQGNLALAQDKVNTLFQLKSEQEDRMYNYNKEIRNIVYDYATKQQQQLLDAQQKADDREFTLILLLLMDREIWQGEL